ncbi:MAG: hypothetical protein IOC80_03640 [Rhodobacter sp.]|nr:hypothetical protein [Rhodobacter sp.]MCA3513234.1 hypothetical protein [Rhodobacter sp.]MCA3520222.1 hypothetical protein [Rhodobacter sp.]MCA3523600.1 hypothetical protein [Rhodobacter sp.]MCA3526157.1 hypothetical protein [Rhodobacter sp.]
MRRLRAVTLIESVLFVSVALGLIVGGLAVYQQSSLSERSSSQMRMLGSIVAETRSLYEQKLNLPSLASTADPMFLSAVVDDVLISADAVAATYLDASAPPNRLGWASPIRHGWKGAMNILAVRRDGSVPHMLVYIEDIPSEVCVRLSSMTATGKTGFVEQMTEIVFQVPDGGGGFNIAKLPSVTYPLPITPDDLALPAHCGPAGGRVNVIYWVPLD